MRETWRHRQTDHANGRRGVWSATVRLHRRVRDTAGVPDLIKDEATLGVDCISDELPSGDLVGRVHTRCARIASGRRRDISGLGDQQTTLGCTLSIVDGVHLLWDVTRLLGAQTSQGRHDDAVLKSDCAELQRLEEGHLEMI